MRHADLGPLACFVAAFALATAACSARTSVAEAPPARAAEPAPVAHAGPMTAPPATDAGPAAQASSITAGETVADGGRGADGDPAANVKVVTIGMHVGGGPYDEPTKEPIKRSVEPHFADLARCWRHVTKPHPTDVGVDLVIEGAGGRARVSNPRGVSEGEGFGPCVVAFFESIDFERPKNGKTVVSYSVRFTPVTARK